MGKLSRKRVLQAVQNDETVGFCIGCGTEHEGIEPDAEKYQCRDGCGLNKVYGAEQIVLMFM